MAQNGMAHDEYTPYMARLLNTTSSGVLLINIPPTTTNREMYNILINKVRIALTTVVPGTTQTEKLIEKVEVRWGGDVSVYPEVSLFLPSNALALLKMMKVRSGKDVLHITMETDEDREKRVQGLRAQEQEQNIPDSETAAREGNSRGQTLRELLR